MSSTEQKNVVQPFIDHCFTYGILPTILTGAFDSYPLSTEAEPFVNLGATSDFGKRLRCASNPINEARKVLPILSNAKPVSRLSPLILALCGNARVVSGNQAVLRFAEGVMSDRWGLHFSETPAIRHARKHTIPVCGLLAAGAYSESNRACRNARRLIYSGESLKLRVASDVIDLLNYGTRPGKYSRQVRQWCTASRDHSGFQVCYRKEKQAVIDFGNANRKSILKAKTPPELKQRLITTSRNARYSFSVYKYGSTTYFRITQREQERRWINQQDVGGQDASINGGGQGEGRRKSERIGLPQSELYVLSRRDLDDLRFLFHSGAQVRNYCRRRFYDNPRGAGRSEFKRLSNEMWSSYLEVMRQCGNSFNLRNKLGVYFDVLQWRYLAWKSGDEFYDHSKIMGQKIYSKGLSDLPSQSYMLTRLKKVKMDMAVDMLGIYKASIYPEVDPFKVVVDQKKLHYSRFETNWEEGSEERVRFNDTKSYMWYFGVRVLKKRTGIWPGRIRAGAEQKPWHAKYLKDGIPSTLWREAHDVDLTGVVPVTGLTNEQYMKQQDSACAPPRPRQYESFDALRKSPRYHKRKILYAIQEPDLPDLEQTMSYLDQLGRGMGEGHVDPISYELPFSTDIVTGSRCERHKDAPRPFYAASSPWGCILSYIDGLTRDFLAHVPQSLFGKSTRQKYIDISTAGTHHIPATRSFFMSDDKAKYSPRMDPNSQQLPADFFAEVFNLPGIKACGPIMYHNNLFYRVCGHLVSYNSNGTDREGMRGASNTWLEIVAQGLATRLSRDRGLISGKSIFLAFIDDGLRKFSVVQKGRSEHEIHEAARSVIDEVIFGLRVLGRELSWDKTFVSQDLFVILNEMMYDNAHMSSGLKSFCTAGDLEMKEVMGATDYEQLYFGKMRGAHGVGTPLDLCHCTYVFETLLSHFKMGLNLQDNHKTSNVEYRLFVVTPVALGGGGFRSLTQLGCNEVASATKEGIGNLVRMGKNLHIFSYCVERLLNQPHEDMNPIDFMREPEQFHVSGPRLKSQRLAAEVRKRLSSIACNELSQKFVQQDREGLELLRGMGKALMATGEVSAEDVRLLYALTPVAFIDEFIQKLASSSTLSTLLGSQVIGTIRRAVKRDLIAAVSMFRYRCDAITILNAARGELQILATISQYVV